ncbi:hypothetical protein [Haloprofundus marisrubri]|uniref:hypothetical protein n=1 Tax=Haloprofundus marisrubri TaxID=1514971 RepID=UPI0008F83FAD|nr:hypothetical protein [Haloprofundus marisrubri]
MSDSTEIATKEAELDSAELSAKETEFAVYRRGDGWHWQWGLPDGDVAFAYSGHAADSPADAAANVDRVRALTSREGIYSGYVSFEVGHTETGELDWRLVDENEAVLAIGATTRDSYEAVEADIERFRIAAETATVHLHRPADTRDVLDANSLVVDERPSISAVVRSLPSLLGRGTHHRRTLANIEKRVVVSGIRGKSSTVRRLDDIFSRRGYDTLTKITGNHPVTIHNGEVIPIDRRGTRTTLYENIPILRQFGHWFDQNETGDVAIVENQGITEYTTRLFNQRFVQPHVVVLTNVRLDHNDTLGADRQRLARSFARSIPAGTHVVSGEQHPVLHEYLREEVERRGATIEQVSIPERHRRLLGAETVHALDAVLRSFGLRGLSDAQLDSYLDGAQPNWIRLPKGRVFNGAEVNDIESTEMVRQALAGDDRVLPFVYLRRDRRGRTASFAEYLNVLADRGVIDRARVGGWNAETFARHVDVPCTTHDRDENAGAVLDEMLAEGDPVLLMGNTVDEFMREMEQEIITRAGAYDTLDEAVENDTADAVVEMVDPVSAQWVEQGDD